MRTLPALIMVAPLFAALQGCSGRADEATTLSMTSSEVSYFNLAVYEEAEAATNAGTITGTWVGAWNYRTTYEDPGESVLAESPEYFARLEVVVVRKTTDGYEISDCARGAFVEASLSDGYLTSARGQFSLTDENRLVTPTVSQRLYSDPYAVSLEISAEGVFVKVSDDTVAFGSYTGDWTGDNDNFSGPIVCAQVDNLAGGGQRMSFGGTNNTHFTMSQRPLITDYDAELVDAANDISYERTRGEGEYQLSIYDLAKEGFTFSFTITSDTVSPLGAVGQGSVNIPLP